LRGWVVKFNQQIFGDYGYIGFYFLKSEGILNNFHVPSLPVGHQRPCAVSACQNERAVLATLESLFHYGAGKPFKFSE
jgi:hypothetical protein